MVLQQSEATIDDAEGQSRLSHPLAVDLDGTLLRTDTLYETFAMALFRRPLATLLALFTLARGIAHLKQALAEIAELDIRHLPYNEELVRYLEAERELGRSIHLVTAADRSVADRIAARFAFIESAHSSENGHNLKGAAKAQLLETLFPAGFAYAGDSSADFAVWRKARAAVVVGSDGLSRRVAGLGIPVERAFKPKSNPVRAWFKALRPHQWSKNGLVLVPLALGWWQVTPAGWLAGLASMLLLCAVASLTYCINDIADLAADRRHWSKRNRPFASGAIAVRTGLLVAGLGLPIALVLGLLISPAVAVCLISYTVTSLAYSFGLKRVPLLDTFIIACLFSLRIALGTAAAELIPSSWLLTFSMFFFFSLAVAKRHTELLRAGETMSGLIEGRGYHVEDKDVTFAFGIVASLASVLIIVIYLVQEVFPHDLYTHPDALWAMPAAIFLWTGRIWLLAHRGQMRDDPVVFALSDRISLGLGGVVGLAFLLALL
jgi:4-hydroxybenzoate polyprenyltransferase